MIDFAPRFIFLLVTIMVATSAIAASKNYRVYCEYGHKKIYAGGISANLKGCNLSAKQHDVKFHKGKKQAYCVIIYS